jgi:hypothetical protein
LSSKKYITSFEVNASGELIPTELSTKTTDTEKVILIIDEASMKIYLWIGSESSKNNRMVAKRIANSIPIFGLRVKGLDFPVGKDCKIAEVDESQRDSDKLAHSNLVELENLLKRPHAKLTEGIWYAREAPLPRKEKLDTEARVLESRMQYEMGHLEKETVEKDKKRRTEERRK